MTELLKLLGDLPEVDFPAGTTLIKQSDSLDRIYVLKQGEVRITKDGTSICTISSEGSAFGEISALLGVKSTASVTTTRDSTLAVIEHPLDELTQHPEITLEIARLLAHRLRWLTMTYAEEIDDGESVFWAGR